MATVDSEVEAFMEVYETSYVGMSDEPTFLFSEASFSALSEPTIFTLPPEVAALLEAGTNPFASLASSYTPQTTAGAPSGAPTTVATPGLAPAKAGSGGLIGLGGLPSGLIVSPLSVVVTAYPLEGNMSRGALVEDWSLMPSGEIHFERVRNRQPGGVRFGTLPMIVFQDLGGSDTRSGGGIW